MRNTPHFFQLTCVTVLMLSCKTFVLPDEFTGYWKSAGSKITVRTMEKFARFTFTSDSATIFIHINENKASGKIGNAGFDNAVIVKNTGNPEKTGVAYIVKCGKIAGIFKGDPLDSKEVELWLGPLKNNNSLMHCELRFTEGLALFPMAGFDLYKQPEK